MPVATPAPAPAPAASSCVEGGRGAAPAPNRGTLPGRAVAAQGAASLGSCSLCDSPALEVSARRRRRLGRSLVLSSPYISCVESTGICVLLHQLTRFYKFNLRLNFATQFCAAPAWTRSSAPPKPETLAGALPLAAPPRSGRRAPSGEGPWLPILRWGISATETGGTGCPVPAPGPWR